MQTEDRPIHYSSELIHAPKRHERQALQRLYFELSQTPKAAYDNTDFTNPVQPRFSSRRGERAQSVLLILPDRLFVIEEWVDLALVDYIEKLKTVCAHAMDALAIPRILVQTVTIRTTFALSHFDDARVFLLDHAFAQAERLQPYFQRPLATGGLRLVFPETPDHPGTIHLLIESYRHRREEVFVEAKSIYANQNFDRGMLEIAAQNVRECRRFITDHVHPYLEQFDTRHEDPV